MRLFEAMQIELSDALTAEDHVEQAVVLCVGAKRDGIAAIGTWFLNPTPKH